MKRLMTTIEFNDTVEDIFRRFPLKDLFFLEDFQIDDAISQWRKQRSYIQFQDYIVATMTLSREQSLDNLSYCLYVARDMLDEIVVTLAESYYYDEWYGNDIIPNIDMAFLRGDTKGRLDSLAIKEYFLDVFDVQYGRIYDNQPSTLTYLYSLTNDKRYIP